MVRVPSLYLGGYWFESSHQDKKIKIMNKLLIILFISLNMNLYSQICYNKNKINYFNDYYKKYDLNDKNYLFNIIIIPCFGYYISSKINNDDDIKPMIIYNTAGGFTLTKNKVNLTISITNVKLIFQLDELYKKTRNNLH